MQTKNESNDKEELEALTTAIKKSIFKITSTFSIAFPIRMPV
jgi:hypothetical protein